MAYPTAAKDLRARPNATGRCAPPPRRAHSPLEKPPSSQSSASERRPPSCATAASVPRTQHAVPVVSLRSMPVCEPEAASESHCHEGSASIASQPATSHVPATHARVASATAATATRVSTRPLARVRERAKPAWRRMVRTSTDQADPEAPRAMLARSAARLPATRRRPAARRTLRPLPAGGCLALWAPAALVGPEGPPSMFAH